MREDTRPGTAYGALAARLRSAIDAGDFDGQTPLPTEKDLARRHEISRQTVRRAFQELVAEGLVYRVPGRGTFVTPPDARYRRAVATVDDLLALPTDTEMEIVEPLRGDYDEEAARALDLRVRQLYSLTFLRRHRGVTFCRTRCYLPSAVGLALEEVDGLARRGHVGTDTVIGLIEARGHHIAGAEQAVAAVAAGPDEVAALGAASGSPVLRIARTYVDDAGTPLEYAVSDYLPEFYTHRQHLGRTPLA